MSFNICRPQAPWRGLLLAALLFSGALATAAPVAGSTELFIDGSRYQALLEPSTARIGMSDEDRQHLQGNHYSGTLEQVPGSWVRLSHLDGDWSGVVSLNGKMHIIDSASFPQNNNLPVARTLQSLQAPGTCGVGDGTHSSLELPTRESASARSGGYEIAAATLEEMCTEQVDGVCLLPEKYLIVDHLFQQKYPDTYQDKVVELLNIIDGFYRNDLNMVFDNLHVEFPSEELLLESTSSNELLVNLRDKYHTFPFADTSTSSPLIELLSGREFDGSTVGLAYVNTLCNSNGYATGVTQQYVNIPLTAIVMAHEIGHNFGANHDNVEADQVDNPERYCGNGYIMSSYADPSATGFSSCSVKQMTAKINSISNHDACFNYPVDAGISADTGNLNSFDDISGNQLSLAFPLSYQQASRSADQWNISGAISNGTASSVNLAGGDCSLNADQRGYQCTLLPPFTDHAITLTVHSDNSQDVLIQQEIQSSGSEVKDIALDNNSLNTTLAVNLTSTQPGDLAAAGQDNPLQVQLTWTDQAHGETGYRVERQIDGQTWQTLTTLAADSSGHTDTGVDTDISYQYRVTAEGDGINGTHSNLASVRIEGVPARPSGLQASLPGSGIALSWQDNADNEVAYRVDRQRQNGTSWTPWTTLSDNLDANTQQYTDTTAVPGETYQYRVFALNQTLISDASETVQIHYQTLPASPSGVSASRNGNQIDLSWSHDSDNTHTIIVERQLDNDGWQTLATLGNVSSHSDTDLQLGRAHQYRVIARNDRGDSAPSSTASVQLGEQPAAPSNLEAQLNGTSVNLNWVNNADNADAIILERRIDDGEWLRLPALAGNATSYTDSLTQTGSTHHYRVFAQNEEGNSTPSNEVSLLVEILPAAPSNLSAQLDGTSVTLSWSNNADNADTIIIERQLDSGTWAEIANLAGATSGYTDSATQTGSTHNYRVYARNTIGDSSASNEASVLVDVLPTAPSNLTAQLDGTNVLLSWDNNADNATAIIIEQKIDSGAWNEIANLGGDVSSYTDNATQTGSTHLYRVYARNSIGDSDLSNEASLLVEVLPAAPSNLTAQLDGSNVLLSWSNNADNANAVILERQIDGGAWIEIANLNDNATSHTDSATQVGSTHHYRVYTRNTIGDSNPSNEASVLVDVLPAAPSGLTAQLDGTDVLLNWSNNANNADQLRIERQLDNGGWLPLTSVAGNATSFTDSNSQYGSQHAYRVLASNTAGESVPSNTAQVLVLLAPQAPTGLSAQSTNTTVQLRWDSADSPFINALRLERKTDGGNWQPLATLAATSDVYRDENLSEGVYRYRLIAINLAGESVASAAVEASITLPPAAPSELRAQRQNNTVVLLWLDNADNEFGFRIERQQRDGNTWLPWQAVAELNANVTTFKDSRVKVGNSYRYRVTSLNSAGRSTPSAAAAITLNDEITPTGDDDNSDEPLPGSFGDDGGSAGFLTGLLALLVLRRRGKPAC